MLLPLGCIGGPAGAASLLIGPLFTQRAAPAADTTGGGTTDSGGGFFTTGNRANLDPCEEPNARKFVTISMRNLAPDHIHYFLALIAFVNTDTQNGAVCPDDIELYTDFGYTFVPENSTREFGDYCFEGPVLIYFHENGNFRSGTGFGANAFASAIPPAQGSNPSFDAFFTSAGARVPVPDQILFHNPGTGEGAALQIAQLTGSPCTSVVVPNTNQCSLDAFYYVDESDLLTGSTALGAGSARRVPNEIQGTGCTVGFQEAFARLAPSGTTALTAQENEFLRGGRIEFTFIREDLNPPIPQLLWRVTDAGGGIVHEPDPRAEIP
ncbi:MAG: hypothetical protein D6744_08740 [Planctomycetota bacterium]|nr:MAG: hypothetical protein D6744_08740 [Planctomycetota bacterium]